MMENYIKPFNKSHISDFLIMIIETYLHEAFRFEKKDETLNELLITALSS